RAVRAPKSERIVYAGLLLGAASALKPTNAVHALSAFALLLFLPTGWKGNMRHALRFIAALGLGFAAISIPWSVHLERHFGNPLFPMLNTVFRSPQFPTGPMLDYRFIPSSLGDALRRPFEIVAPVNMVDDEFPAPDLRYALLLVIACVAALLWTWRRLRHSPATTTPRE